ncbi:hydroxysteroid dehydrogenase-like protein 2 isoform X2 [Nilaparvata lugens]|uniref:hydroxysteroid dehydrogenase-like protein 2 isoform X1 n=1 Tax=Nilaparvata lugens TaxID=108931 RepID=UPI00193E5405|nr:hydroxysteroid dehydrogenase-like protein 2 isoform X1 [Nilaparvata lugens]XP_039287046.1 hydroxysteroid dehydrogenase-like protein 2 isoform X2 [Nilaparvata lugens]
MINTGKLAGRTIFITGASRGIGKAIAVKAAKDGANVIIAAKTADPHPKLPGTIYSAAKEVEAAGGKALPCVVDVREESQIKAAVDQAVSKFGGIDIVVNNASAINLTGTLETDMKRYDLMHHINTRGTFLVSKVCLPYLKKSSGAHILNLSPPLNMAPHWFKDHLAYTMAKYGMSMCVLGMAEEFRSDKIAVNALWPKTAIHTAAIEMLTGPESGRHSRKPEIVADAAYAILCKDPTTATGNFFIDEDVLRQEGLTQAQIDAYACDPSNNANLMPDFFLDLGPDKIVSGWNVQVPVGSTTAATKSVQDASSAGAGGAAAAPSVEAIFKAIEDNLSTELVSKTQAVFVFHVTGSEQGMWYIDLKGGKGSAGKGEPSNAADATLTMDSNDFYKMFSGKLKPAAAFMTGKLKISGNLQKAMKLEKLMSALKAKL